MGSSAAAGSGSGGGGSGGVPPGFRFHPTDEELLHFYLKKKVSFQKFDMEVIREVDLNKMEPWDLQERCKIGSTPQNEWYFFSHKDRKYPTGSRTNRATSAGFWKATGRDKCIRNSFKKIGMRKTLVFYRGRAPHGQKTDWIMHEYRLEDADDDPQATHEDGWVVCRVFKKKNLFKVGNININNEGHHSNGGGMMHLGTANSSEQVMNIMSNSSTSYNNLYSRNSASSSSFAQRPSDNNLQHYLLQQPHPELSVSGLNYISHIPINNPSPMSQYPHHEVLEAQNFMMSHSDQQHNIHLHPPVMMPGGGASNPMHVKQFIMSSSGTRDNEYSCSTADHQSPVSDPYQACDHDPVGRLEERDQPSLAMNVARSDDDRDHDQNLNDWDGLVTATSSHNHQNKGSDNSASASITQINQLSLRGEMDFWAYNGK